MQKSMIDGSAVHAEKIENKNTNEQYFTKAPTQAW